MTPPHGGYPQPKNEMTVEEHMAQCAEHLNDFPEAGDDALHDLMVTVYPKERQQHN